MWNYVRKYVFLHLQSELESLTARVEQVTAENARYGQQNYL